MPITVANWSLKKKALGGYSIKYRCPSCDADLVSPISASGTEDDCPDCGANFVLPEEAVEKARVLQSKIDSDTQARQSAKNARRLENEVEKQKRKELRERERVAAEARKNRAQEVQSSPPPRPHVDQPEVVSRAPSNLIVCADCNREVSSRAPSCPHCGSPMSRLNTLSDATGKTHYTASPAMYRNSPVVFGCTIAICVVGLMLTIASPYGLALTLLGISILLAWWLRCKGTTLIVTDERTTLRRGILSKSINEVWHKDIRNVKITQSFFQRMFGVGTVGISSAAQSDVEIEVTLQPSKQICLGAGEVVRL